MSLDNRKTLAIYQDICTFFIQGWRSLGIALEYGLTKRGYIHNSSWGALKKSCAPQK